MTRGYCERCNMEKSASKGGFCTDCMTHTNTYYAESSRSTMVSSGGFKNVTLEPEAFIVFAPKDPHKKIGKYSEEELDTKITRLNRHSPIPTDDRSRAKKRLKNLDPVIDKKLIEDISSRYLDLKSEIENEIKRKQKKREKNRKRQERIRKEKKLGKKQKRKTSLDISLTRKNQ